ncbi:MAG: NADH-quinone oxidoreductase subunit N [Bacteroidota bacterium]
MNLSEQLHLILRSLPGILPEVGLTIAFLFIIVLDLFLTRNSNQELSIKVLFICTLLSLLVVGGLVFWRWDTPSAAYFSGMLVRDKLAVFFQLLFLLAAAFTLLHAWSLRKSRSGILSGEGLALLMGMLLGLFLMGMSVNLLLIYLSIELVSLSSYVLTTFNNDKKGVEGGLKYLLFGAISSGVMLYGMSLVYGLTGTLNLTDPAFLAHLSQVPALPLALAGLLTISGFLFKISALPFHFWTPDVYEAAPTPVVAFFSVAPKAAALIILLRFLVCFPPTMQPIIALLALGSMILGNFSALWQTNAKRMLAYSSIAHAGFMLVGVVASNQFGWQSLVFYLTTFLFINLASFFLLDLAAHQSSAVDESDFYGMNRLKGLGLQRPFLGSMLLITMIALTGLPPTAGFSAKLFIFSALWESYQASGSQLLLWVFILGLLNSVVSLFYYLKIPFLLFFRTLPHPAPVTVDLTNLQKILVAVVILPVLLLFFKPDWLMGIIDSSWLFRK